MGNTCNECGGTDFRKEIGHIKTNGEPEWKYFCTKCGAEYEPEEGEEMDEREDTPASERS